MSHRTHHRGARAVGVATILVLAVGGPAMARQDAGDVTPQGSKATTQITDEQYRCHYLNECTGAATSRIPGPSADGYAVEFLQVGAGVLAGIGIAGAGLAAAASRRRHGHAVPA